MKEEENRFLDTDPDAPCVLHLYAQKEPGGEAYLVGSFEGLSRLRALLDYMIRCRPVGKGNFVTADGQDFQLRISMASEGESKALALPYSKNRSRVSKSYHITPNRLVRENAAIYTVCPVSEDAG
ncbi:hypothetical protein ACSSZE_03180 [Acidithiobacillus caldus]